MLNCKKSVNRGLWTNVPFGHWDLGNISTIQKWRFKAIYCLGIKKSYPLSEQLSDVDSIHSQSSQIVGEVTWLYSVEWGRTTHPPRLYYIYTWSRSIKKGTKRCDEVLMSIEDRKGSINCSCRVKPSARWTNLFIYDMFTYPTINNIYYVQCVM